MQYGAKRIIVWMLHLVTWPMGLTSWIFQAWQSSDAVFRFWAKLLSLVPGLPGQYLRASFYMQTLEQFHYDVAVGFCSFIAQSDVEVGRRVSIGSFSIIGTSTIGHDVLISSRVSILSGKYQHGGGANEIPASTHPVFERVQIGNGSWLGEGSIVMANLGKGCTISAGSVVTKPVPDGAVAIGNPARFSFMKREGAQNGIIEK